VKKAEKNALRDNGHAWEPLPLEALKQIYEPENLKRTRGIHVRWGALIGLYTGARVSEVAQIFIRDFIELDGVKCVRLTNDSDGQSVKTENSKRLVPLHPDRFVESVGSEIPIQERSNAGCSKVDQVTDHHEHKKQIPNQEGEVGGKHSRVGHVPEERAPKSLYRPEKSGVFGDATRVAAAPRTHPSRIGRTAGAISELRDVCRARGHPSGWAPTPGLVPGLWD
jgi:hypothetical protein